MSRPVVTVRPSLGAVAVVAGPGYGAGLGWGRGSGVFSAWRREFFSVWQYRWGGLSLAGRVFGAALYAAHFACNMVRVLRRNATRKARLLEKAPSRLLLKPAEPNFFAEEEWSFPCPVIKQRSSQVMCAWLLVNVVWTGWCTYIVDTKWAEAVWFKLMLCVWHWHGLYTTQCM